MSNTVTSIPKPNIFPPNLAKYVGMLLETRKYTLELINGIDQDCLDFMVSERKIESIATSLFHIAAIEFSWILEDIGKQEMDEETWKYAFSLRKGVNIDQIKGKSLSYYTDVLSNVRKEALDMLVTLTDADLDKILTVDERQLTIEWILYHVNRHEMYHNGQINLLKRMYALHQ